MEYYLNEIRDPDKIKANSKNAAIKARDDASCEFSALGMLCCDLPVYATKRESGGFLSRLLWHIRAITALRASLNTLRCNDTLYVQFPILGHSVFQGAFFRHCARRGVRIVLLIHDLLSLREIKNTRRLRTRIVYSLEEVKTLYASSRIIVHNERMKEQLADMGIPAEKLVSLEIFDYLMPDNRPLNQSRYTKDGGVLVAGNLIRKKSGFLYELPENVHWNLYGVGYEDEKKSHVDYRGSFLPEELIEHLQGGFGLVWDGPTAETCAGAYGEYLRINNPHKTSLYLAAGLPVIIWKEAALAPFIEGKGLGFAVSTLGEIAGRIGSITEQEYSDMLKNARAISGKLRSGYFLTAAVERVREAN